MPGDVNGCWDPCPKTHVRHFGAMDIEFERRDEIAVRVQVRLSTMLVALALLAPEQLEWDFEVEAGGAAARGKMQLDLGAPRYYTTIAGALDYTASGTWNSYRGLLWHWEATGLPPGRPIWVDPFAIERNPRSGHGRRGLREGSDDQEPSGERWATGRGERRVRLGDDAATSPVRGSARTDEGE